ncbi:MAG: helix-turn-helix domain-containing protein [Verrucomicrobiota bacterium]|jgi:hypothetical protein
MIQRTKPESATSNTKLADKSQPQHTPGNDLPHGDRQFLTNSQLQEILPLSRRSIFEWRRKGILPSIQVGSKILYHRESVIAALLRQQRGGGE